MWFFMIPELNHVWGDGLSAEGKKNVREMSGEVPNPELKIIVPDLALRVLGGQGAGGAVGCFA